MSTTISRRNFMKLGGVAALGVAATGIVGCSSSSSSSSGTGGIEPEDAGTPVEFVTPVAEAEEAVWKVDYVNDELSDDFVLDNWRTSADEFNEDSVAILSDLGLNTDVSREGMDTLQTAGGADFTANQFDWILDTLSEQSGVSAENLTVMDLRGENHGLIDGNVFMRWIENNFVNEGKTTDVVLEEESEYLEEFKAQSSVTMYQTNDDWGADFENSTLTFTDAEIMSEEELVTSKGVNYIRFATTNHFRPDDAVVDEFCDFMSGLSDDDWLFMHCYAGEGRTTCFMCMCDIYKNYSVASFDDIAARQGLIGPVDVRTEVVTALKTHYKMKASIERRIFLQQFYRFAVETDFAGETWSEWAQNRGISLIYYVE